MAAVAVEAVSEALVEKYVVLDDTTGAGIVSEGVDTEGWWADKMHHQEYSFYCLVADCKEMLMV